MDEPGRLSDEGAGYNVRAEFSLTALAYNLRRAINLLGVSAMVAAVKA
jgi:hypothetical protein